MKKCFLIMIFISISHLAVSQVSKIKSQLKEILFELPVPSSKYDVRKLLNSSDNYSNILESTFEKYDIISADFKENFKLSHIEASSVREASFWFMKDTDINFSFGFTLKYLPHNVKEGTRQYNEIINFFKPISYKAFERPWIYDGVKRGEWFSAYSSQKQLQKHEAYIITTIQLEKPCKTCTDQNTYYSVSFSFYNR